MSHYTLFVISGISIIKGTLFGIHYYKDIQKEIKMDKEYIKELPRQRLSQFDYDCKTRPHCLFAFINPESGDFIQSDEIEVAIDLLINSNYTVDYKLTKMVKKKGRKLIW